MSCKRLSHKKKPKSLFSDHSKSYKIAFYLNFNFIFVISVLLTNELLPLLLFVCNVYASVPEW